MSFCQIKIHSRRINQLSWCLVSFPCLKFKWLKKHQLKSPQVPIPLPPWFTESPRAVNELSRGDPSIPDSIQLSVKKQSQSMDGSDYTNQDFLFSRKATRFDSLFHLLAMNEDYFLAVWNFSCNSIFRRMIPIFMFKIDFLDATNFWDK